jgi:hypothetical protein
MATRYSTHHIIDEGIRFAPGETVSVVHATGRTQIIQDPAGGYTVIGCRLASEYAGGPLLRVDLKKIERGQVPDDLRPPWSPGR